MTTRRRRRHTPQQIVVSGTVADETCRHQLDLLIEARPDIFACRFMYALTNLYRLSVRPTASHLRGLVRCCSGQPSARRAERRVGVTIPSVRARTPPAGYEGARATQRRRALQATARVPA